jgi:uncharacterized OB-fold protein
MPVATEDSEPYWEYCEESELRMQKCSDCGHVRMPPAVLCPKCLSENNEWVKLSGRGKIWSYVVFHHAYYPGYDDDVPYNTAIIELEEGPRMHTNVVQCENDDLYIGMPVEVLFEPMEDDEDIILPKFKPVKQK